MSDKLLDMLEQQREFMNLLRQKRNFPEFPVDVSSKEGQKFLKGISYECMHELFEAINLLKNRKDHRASDIKDFDKDAYLEEIADVFHYLFEIVIASGISIDQLYDAYMRKGEVNVKRINSGY